jgi:cytoskeleton protein RodZ
MVKIKNYLSFGRYLKNIRLERGIHLDTVSKETRIGLYNLALIENEDHENLPAEVFVKGFLRAYAKAIGADSDRTLALYLSSVHSYKESARFEAELIKSGTTFWPRLLLSLGALVCLMTLSVLGASFFMAPPHVTDSIVPETAAGKSVPEVSKMVVKPEPEPVKNISQNTPEKFILDVVAVEKTWMKVIIDDRTPKEYSLKPGERLELEASSGFNLLIGNAGGVHLKFNDIPVEVAGEKGQVVSLQLP